MFGRHTPPGATPGEAASQGNPGSGGPNEGVDYGPALGQRRRVRPPRGGLLFVLSGAFTFVAVIAAALVFGVLIVERQSDRPGPLSEDKIVLIPKNTGTSEITELLTRERVIDQPRLFELYAYLNRSKGQLRAGEYLFRAHAGIDQVIDTLIQGKPILHAFTAPEGLTSEQIVQRLRENDILTGDITDIPREGTLLPDTYKFDRGTTRQQLVNMMQAAGRQALHDIWNRRAPDGAIRTPQELVILASIVEKETGRPDERARVAGLFLNRLARRMKLQSDPTIVYGLVGGKGTLGRGILKSEIERATPYNTYVIEGLPPGPIANPGRAALEAVANPVKTKDVYFVADGTGGHVFAETYDQHLKNVTRWRQIEKAREAAAPAEVPVDRVEPATGPNTRTELDPGMAGRDPRATSSTAPSTGRGSGFDAVEGTNRDPLKNQAWDLNSAKSVPTFGHPDTAPAQAPAKPRQAAKPAKPAPKTPKQAAPQGTPAEAPL
jgi:UPF0755 protein